MRRHASFRQDFVQHTILHVVHLAAAHSGMDRAQEQRVILRRDLLRGRQEHGYLFVSERLDFFVHDLGVFIKLRQPFGRVGLYPLVFLRVIQHGAQFRQDDSN